MDVDGLHESLVTQPYVCVPCSANSSCSVPCALYPHTLYKYDSTMTLGRQVESPVHIMRTISSILTQGKPEGGRREPCHHHSSLYIIVA
jgi:hypothetical protein